MRNEGYTLVELIISIAIISIMTAIVVGTYSIGREPDTVKFETEKLAGVIRNTRIRAFNRTVAPLYDLSDESFHPVCSLATSTPCTDDSDCSTSGKCVSSLNPPHGYGIYFTVDGNSRTNYTIFADLANAANEPPFFDSDTETVEAVRQPSGIRTFLGSATGPTEGEIIFQPGEVLIYENNGGWSQVTPAGDTYEIYVQDDTLCSSIGKQGIITITISTQTIVETVTNC